jgi:hypothetical protein
MYTQTFCLSILTKGNFKMKSIAILVASLFAVSAFAQAPAKKEEVKPAATASAPAKTEAKKEEKKPAKSEPAKKDAKAATEATKAAAPAAK